MCLFGSACADDFTFFSSADDTVYFLAELRGESVERIRRVWAGDVARASEDGLALFVLSRGDLLGADGAPLDPGLLSARRVSDPEPSGSCGVCVVPVVSPPAVLLPGSACAIPSFATVLERSEGTLKPADRSSYEWVRTKSRLDVLGPCTLTKGYARANDRTPRLTYLLDGAAPTLTGSSSTGAIALLDRESLRIIAPDGEINEIRYSAPAVRDLRFMPDGRLWVSRAEDLGPVALDVFDARLSPVGDREIEIPAGRVETMSREEASAFGFDGPRALLFGRSPAARYAESRGAIFACATDGRCEQLTPPNLFPLDTSAAGVGFEGSTVFTAAQQTLARGTFGPNGWSWETIELSDRRRTSARFAQLGHWLVHCSEAASSAVYLVKKAPMPGQPLDGWMSLGPVDEGCVWPVLAPGRRDAAWAWTDGVVLELDFPSATIRRLEPDEITRRLGLSDPSTITRRGDFWLAESDGLLAAFDGDPPTWRRVLDYPFGPNLGPLISDGERHWSFGDRRELTVSCAPNPAACDTATVTVANSTEWSGVTAAIRLASGTVIAMGGVGRDRWLARRSKGRAAELLPIRPVEMDRLGPSNVIVAASDWRLLMVSDEGPVDEVVITWDDPLTPAVEATISGTQAEWNGVRSDGLVAWAVGSASEDRSPIVRVRPGPSGDFIGERVATVDRSHLEAVATIHAGDVLVASSAADEDTKGVLLEFLEVRAEGDQIVGDEPQLSTHLGDGMLLDLHVGPLGPILVIQRPASTRLMWPSKNRWIDLPVSGASVTPLPSGSLLIGGKGPTLVRVDH